jgi:peptidoglycan hydrolase CwlO-like protein
MSEPFNLEKARAEVATASARRFSESREQARIFCAEEILPDALDEIERLTVEHQNALDEVKNLEEQIEVHHLRRENELRQMNEISAENKKLAARITELEDLVDWGIPEPTYGGEVI